MEILFFSKILHIAGFSDIEVKKQIYLINSLVIAEILASRSAKELQVIQKEIYNKYIDNLVKNLPLSKKLLIEQTISK